ncbi:MAG: hypothetical protein ABH814_03995, partial [bacterium]
GGMVRAIGDPFYDYAETNAQANATGEDWYSRNRTSAAVRAGVPIAVAITPFVPSAVRTVRNLVSDAGRSISNVISANGTRVNTVSLYGDVYIKGRTATKLYRHGDTITSRYEMAQMERYGDGVLLPKYKGRVPGGYKMEAIRGVSLADLPPGSISGPVAESAVNKLSSLQSRGFIHGDIHAGNILVELTQDVPSRVWLIDPKIPYFNNYTAGYELERLRQTLSY